MAYFNFLTRYLTQYFNTSLTRYFNISLRIFKFKAILENLFNIFLETLRDFYCLRLFPDKVTKIYARLFPQPLIDAFKIHQEKTVIHSVTGRHLYMLVILHIICMSLVYHSHLIVNCNCRPMSAEYYLCATRMPIVCFVCHSLRSRMSFARHSYVIRMRFLCTHSCTIHLYLYVLLISLVCYLHVTRLYSYVTRMSLVFTGT